MPRALGRETPPDFEHVRKYPLAALAEPPQGVPVVLGINWYAEFDRPEKDNHGRYWIAGNGKLSYVRGGHAICTKADQRDLVEWWGRYDQVGGSCVGWSLARMKALLDRHIYDGQELYIEVRRRNNYQFPEGAFVRDGLDVLVDRGAVRSHHKSPDNTSRISVYRWAQSASEVIDTLDVALAKRLGAVPLLNSWGTSYPHIVWMTGEVLDRLLREDGEAAIVTDL